MIETLDMLGPGTLTIGAAGPGQLNATAQVRACRIIPTENVSRVEPKRVLSGEQTAAKETVTHSFTVRVRFLQSPETNGVVDYSYDHAGEEQPFTFQPRNAAAAKVEGTLRVVPIEFGGDVSAEEPESEVTFAGIGELPTFTPDAP